MASQRRNLMQSVSIKHINEQSNYLRTLFFSSYWKPFCCSLSFRFGCFSFQFLVLLSVVKEMLASLAAVDFLKCYANSQQAT